MIKNILVTGADGQVGNELRALAPHFSQYHFDFTDRNELDITSAEAVATYFSQHRAEVVINCAAYTAVDKAESEADFARAINVTGVKHLASSCSAHHRLFMHISTDFVYDGTKSSPYVETDSPHPLSVYASTKLDGDLAAMQLNPATIILRTSWVYSTYGHNFLKTMIRLAADRPKLSVVFDQVGTPTYAADIAKVLLEIMPLVNESNYGLYHFSNEGVCSWYDFATEILQAKGFSTDVQPIESKDFPTPVKRPHYSVLNKGKIKETFGISIPHWRSAMLACLHKLDN